MTQFVDANDVIPVAARYPASSFPNGLFFFGVACTSIEALACARSCFFEQYRVDIRCVWDDHAMLMGFGFVEDDRQHHDRKDAQPYNCFAVHLGSNTFLVVVFDRNLTVDRIHTQP
jgi:hypothetical protein